MSKSFNQKFWEDNHGKVVVWQSPNIWLWTWFITMVLNWFLSYARAVQVIGFVSLAALIFWAILELARGVNYFRRLLGLMVLLLLIITRI